MYKAKVWLNWSNKPSSRGCQPAGGEAGGDIRNCLYGAGGWRNLWACAEIPEKNKTHTIKPIERV